MKAWKIAGAAVAALVVITALLLLIGIPSGFMTSAVRARVERETGYRFAIAGSTRLSFWPHFSVTLKDVTLTDVRDRDNSNRLTVGSVTAAMPLRSLWSGLTEVTDLTLASPTLYAPLLRERLNVSAPSPTAALSGETEAHAVAIRRVKVTDGVVVLSNLRDRVEDRLTGIDAEATVDADNKVSATGHARAGEQPVTFEIRATAPVAARERQTIPVELALDAPGALQAPLSAKAEVRLNGAVVMINGLSGAIGDGAFNGWASVDLSSKPLVKLDLDFQRLDIAAAKTADATGQPSGSQPSGSQPWSNATIDLHGLNYVDVQARISAAEINIGSAHVAPAAIDATLAGGVLRCGFQNLGAYDGQASGDVVVDVSGGDPTYALHSDLAGVRALPLLRSAADFDKLDGRLQTKMTLRSQGNSQRAIMANLDGTVFANFRDGAIRGVNVAQMIRSLTSGVLSGWQGGQEQTTDLTQLSASFRIEKGQATTGDINLVGPLVRVTGSGTVDLAARALALRVEPKLVMTTEGQGRTSEPVGLGIPVVIDGPWTEPRIYPDVTGILDNPDAAYGRLKEMGKGLFGNLGGSGAADGNRLSGALGGNLGETLGNLIQQGLGQGGSQGRGISPPASAPASPPTTTEPATPDSQPMNDVLRQLFNR